MNNRVWRLAAGLAVLGAMMVAGSAAAAVPSFSDVPAISGDPNFCISKDDGAYKHPDCRVYYSCSSGIASQVDCPSGQVFDATKNPDDDPAKSYCAAPQSAAHVDCSELAVKK